MKRKEGWYWYRKAGPEIHPWEMVWVFSTHSVIRFGSSAAPGTCFDVERIENMHGDWHGPIALPGEEQASQWNSVEDSSPGDWLRVLLWTPVTESLPEIGVPVLLTDGKTTLVGERMNAEYLAERGQKPWKWRASGVDGYEWDWEFDSYGNDPVTHWMPCPECP